MKTTRLLVASMVYALGFCQLTAARAAATAEQEVTGLVKELSQACIMGDTARIDQVLASDWELVTMAGERWTKANTLDMIKSKKLVIRAEDYSDMQARVYGDTAVVTARVVGKGDGWSNEQRASYVFVRKDGRWQCIHTQGTVWRPEDWVFVARDSNGRKPRIGVYDSRALAVAYSLSQVEKATEGGKAAEFDAEMRKARESGDRKQAAEVEAKYKDVIAALVKRQKQVFSTAPVDDILEKIKDQMAEITKAAHVEAVVSKWDKQAFAKYENAERVDLTMPIIYAFRPAMNQVVVAAGIMTTQPMPLAQAEKIDWTKPK